MNQDQKKCKRKAERNLEQEFEQSMCEDMRGAMEGMDALPTVSAPPKKISGSIQQSESMVNEGGHP